MSYGGLQIQLVTDSVNSSFSCSDSVDGVVQLKILTSLIVNVDVPHCGNNVTCIRQFNSKQLTTIKSFFQFVLSFAPHLKSLSIPGVVINDSTYDIDVTLQCSNGRTLNSDGACCPPGKHIN